MFDRIISVDPGSSFAVASKVATLDIRTSFVASFEFRSPRFMWSRITKYLKAIECAKDESVVVVIEGTFPGRAGFDQLSTMNRRIGSLWTRFAVRGDPVFLAKAGRVRNGVGWIEDLGMKGTSKSKRMEWVEEELGIDIGNDHESDAVLLLQWFEMKVGDAKRLGVPIEDVAECLRKL